MNISDYLKIIVENEASDLYLTCNAPASIKVHGKVIPVSEEKLSGEQISRLAHSILTKEQIEEFKLRPEINMALSEPNVGRFRINMFQQRNNIAVVIRSIKTVIPSPEELGLPPILKQLVLQKRGLILIVGATSSGKSTTLASMIDYRNRQTDGHIITIEDPIEYLHRNKTSLVNQREVGVDTLSYEDALKNTLRQAPDVILIGEIRAQDTMEYAVTFAETGHLCLSTLHANNANQALDRIIHFFPPERREQLLLDLSFNLVAIISQRLIPSLDNKRVVAVEVMLGTPLIRDLIKRGEVTALKDIMEKSENLGMKTFDSAIYDLYKAGKVSYEEALRNADSQNNLRLRIALEERSQSGNTRKPVQKSENLTLEAKKLQGSGPQKPGEFISDRNRD